jgi:hypothetical protein
METVSYLRDSMESCCVPKLNSYLLKELISPGAITKEFPKVGSSNMNAFLKATGNCVRVNYQP